MLDEADTTLLLRLSPYFPRGRAGVYKLSDVLLAFLKVLCSPQ